MLLLLESLSKSRSNYGFKYEWNALWDMKPARFTLYSEQVSYIKEIIY